MFENNIFLHGKYEWKTLEEVAKEDIFYLIRLYWEEALSRKDSKRNAMKALENIINRFGHTVMDQKAPFFIKTAKFWKYIGKDYTYIYEKDNQYFWWLYRNNNDQLNPNKNLQFTLASIAKEAGCTLYNDDPISYEWVSHFCKACKTNHASKKKK